MRARKLDVLALRSSRRRRRPEQGDKSPLALWQTRDESEDERKDLDRASAQDEREHGAELTLKSNNNDDDNEDDNEDVEEDGTENAAIERSGDGAVSNQNTEENDDDEGVNAALRALKRQHGLAPENELQAARDGQDAPTDDQEEKSSALLTSMDEVLVGLSAWQVQRQETVRELEASLAQENAAQDAWLSTLALETEAQDGDAAARLSTKSRTDSDSSEQRDSVLSLQQRIDELSQSRQSAESGLAAARVFEGVTSKTRSFASLRRNIDALGQGVEASAESQRHATAIDLKAQEELEGVMDLQAQLDAYTSDLDALLQSPSKSARDS